MASSNNSNNQDGTSPSPIVDLPLTQPITLIVADSPDHQPILQQPLSITVPKAPTQNANMTLENSVSQEQDAVPKHASHSFNTAAEQGTCSKASIVEVVKVDNNEDNDLSVTCSNCLEPTSQTSPMHGLPCFHPHQPSVFAHNTYFCYNGQGISSNLNNGAIGPSTASSQQPWMNPALLLNPKGKNQNTESAHRNSLQPGLGPNGSQSGSKSQPILAFEFSNTNGVGFEADQSNEYKSGTHYSNSNHFSSSDLTAPSDFRSFSGSEPSAASPYPIPHHIGTMANGLPASPHSAISNFAPNGMGSMIERMNNVQDRSTVPVAKRQKMMSNDDSEGGPKNGFSRSSSGILSSYLKDKQRAALPMLGVPAPASGGSHATLDLTGGNCSPFFYRDTQAVAFC